MFQSYTNKALFRNSPVVATLFLHHLQFNTFAERSLQENRKDWIIVYVEKLISISYSYVFFLKHNFPVLPEGTIGPVATFQYRM